MTTVIEATGLTRRFGDFTAVDRVSFSVKQGEIVGYLGPNGSGKTTTIRMLLGILKPSEGEAQVLGLDIRRQAEQIRQQVGYVSQKFALYQELTAWENLQFYGGVYGTRDEERMRTLLDELGLSKVTHQMVSGLPLGWRQRLALAVALIHKPRLVFLDEPTSGVDPLARRSFWELIYKLAGEGVTILVTTHYMDEAEYCDRVRIMRSGQLLVMDTPEKLKQGLNGSTLEVTAAPLLQAVEAANSYAGVQRAALSGDQMHLTVARSFSVEAYKKKMAQQGIDIPSIQPTTPTMEDVFFSVLPVVTLADEK